MDEDKKPEEVKKPERTDFLKEARELAERNEKAVEEMKRLTERNEEIAAFNKLGGRTDNPQPEKKDEEVTPEKIQKDMDKLGW